MAMRTAHLFDFDGVLLRKHKAHNVIGNQCSRFVGKVLNIRDPVQATEVNKHLYTTYGHSYLGLRGLGYDVDLDEFNAYVYGRFDYYSHFKEVRHTHKEDVDEFLKIYQNELVQPHACLFSNAPDKWCYTIMEMMGLPVEIKSMSDVTMNTLKPMEACYQSVETYLNQRGYDHFVFYDDTMVNLKKVAHKPYWTKVLISQNVSENPTYLAHDFTVASKPSHFIQSKHLSKNLKTYNTNPI